MRRLTESKIVGVAIVGLLLVLLISGCLKYPIGDAEHSKVDLKWAGYWLAENDQGGTLIVVVPFDDRAYYVQQVNYRQTVSGIAEQKSVALKGWLTDVKGTTFFSAEPIMQRMPNQKQPGFYQVTRIKLTGEKAQTNEIEDEFEAVKNANSVAELMAAVEKNVDNGNLYKSELDYRKLDIEKPTEKALIDAILGNENAGN